MRDGTTVGDSSQEARSHAMSVEPNIASVDYMGDRLTFFDCPGSIEFIHDMHPALPVCDAAIVVCEADPRKIPALQVIMRELEELGLPRILFLNKIDQAGGSLRETLEMLQPASRTPLLLRQIPLWENGVATGFVDLALERAFVYRESAPSEVVDMPAGVAQEEKHARYSMLEKLADYDDALMEQLLSDLDPPKDLVFDDLARELREGKVVPVLIGSATEGHGVTRLLKAVRHEAPAIGHTRARLGVDDAGPALAQVIRTVHTAHGGKLSLARVLRGGFADGATVINSRGVEERIGGLARLTGAASAKIGRAEEGDTVAFARLENLATGDRFAEGKVAPAAADLPPPPPSTQAFAIKVKDRKDEVRLAAALAKLCEEDPALSFVQDAEMSEMKLHGQGEMHLRVTTERLADRFGVTIQTHKPTVAYRETIRDKVTVRGRHKKQSGGHGQFGDVVVDVEPRARGEGFAFSETVHGGAVPRQYFSSVEAGSRDAMDARTARFPGGRRFRDPDRRLLSHCRFVRHGVPRRRPHRPRRGAGQGAPGVARADPVGHDLRALGRARARQRPRQRPPRPDPRLRAARGLEGMGGLARPDPRGGDRRPDHRAPVGDLRGRRLRDEVRPSRRAFRQGRRPRGRVAPRRQRKRMNSIAPRAENSAFFAAVQARGLRIKGGDKSALLSETTSMADATFERSRLATVFGGSGFVGRHVVRALVSRGWRVRVAVRRPELAFFLQPIGGVGQIEAVQANLRYPASIAAALEGAEMAVNASGVRAESGAQTYRAVHVDGAQALARAARASGVRTFALLSGIGADPGSSSPYIASKGEGEEATTAEFQDATILRPSVVFGPEDDFFNRFGALARFLPVIPLFAGGKTRLQPVYVGDVARAAAAALAGEAKPGTVYELGGPDVMTLREAAETALRTVDRPRLLVGLPNSLSYMIASTTTFAGKVTLGRFPKLLTTNRDQIDLLAFDNVVSAAAEEEGRTLNGLGIETAGGRRYHPILSCAFP